MLVMSRRVGEEIVIDQNIVLRVIAVKRNRITIGVTAPLDVKIKRAELLLEVLAPPTTEVVADQPALLAPT